jgi:hypothetical protein
VKVAALAGSVLVAAGLVGVALAFHGGGLNSSTGSDVTPIGKGPGFPRPPHGAVVYAREWRRDALALGVVPQRGQVLAQVSVLGTQGVGVAGLPVSVNGRAAAACGKGCYSTTLAGAPSIIDVHVRSTEWRIALPSMWPPRDAAALLARAGRAWRSLRSLSFHESLSSDPTHSAKSAWRVEAPDRVAYQVVGGWAGIVVGERRWDRSPTSKRWIRSSQTRLTQPLPTWVRVTDAHILGTTTVAGRPAWRVSFFDPETPAWFTVTIDRETYLTLDSHMTATSHFMHDVYGAFNTTPQISPPTDR